MTDGLDLSSLTDDQLVELSRVVAHEIGRRSPALQDAARAAVLDEGEKARIAVRAAEAEAARQRQAERERVATEAADKVRAAVVANPETAVAKQWAADKTLAQMVVETLGAGWSIQVWNREGDIRVYLDGPDDAKVSYWATGNGRHPPGRLSIENLGRVINRPRILAIVRFATKRWTRREKFCCDAAAAADIKPIPFPADYAAAAAGVST